MTERMADSNNLVSEKHLNLYKRWSEGGCGLLISGNVMVDRYNIEGAGNIILEEKNFGMQKNMLKRWTDISTKNNTHFWMQLSHAGRQTPGSINSSPLAPSRVRLKIPGRKFGHPVEMSTADIKNTISQFVFAAKAAKEVGFTGIQIHSAHGYLLSQFLSPNINIRKDEWGGSIKNRSRLLVQIIRSCRTELGKNFPISVKLNSADFQKGGFSNEESIAVAKILQNEKIDLLEISGGTYEQAKFLGYDKLAVKPKKNILLNRSSIAREAYFLSYAEKISSQLKLPLMVTGGFRSQFGMNSALSNVCEMIGVARPLCTDPLAVKKLLLREIEVLPIFEDKLSIGKKWLSVDSPITIFKSLNALSIISWYYVQLRRMGSGLNPNISLKPLRALIINEKMEKKSIKIYRKRIKND
ncbi:NADH:flavin oxidoreductase [bacterium]|nr:MAG: NADH:flavin oxidoreductase [bacterium]|tara:strand:+ start:1458 stop:2693 length:1236 start_codon:yes stop_codon:yes gene_type:complete